MMLDRMSKIRQRIGKAKAAVVTLNQPPDKIIEYIGTLVDMDEFLVDLGRAWGVTEPVAMTPGIPLGEVSRTPECMDDYSFPVSRAVGIVDGKMVYTEMPKVRE